MTAASASEFPEMDAALATLAAFEQPPPIPLHALPNRQYLEQAIIPLLIHGLEATAKERPNDPLEFLAAYLLSNNPQREDPLPQQFHPLLFGAGFSTVASVQTLQARQDLQQAAAAASAAADASSVPPTASVAPSSKK